MRVVVATDAIGALSSAEAGALLAAAWPRAQVTVLPVGDAGRGFATAVADSWGVELVSGVLDGRLVAWANGPEGVVVAVADRPAPGGAQQASGPGTGIPATASTWDLGRTLRQALWERSGPVGTVLLDLAGSDAHDGGAGLLAALGALADVPLDAGVAGLRGVDRLNLGPVRQALGGARLVGVVPAEELERPLLGLRGITSLRGRAEGYDAAELLATDAALERFAALVAPGAGALAGAGACGGLGLAVLGLGGRLATGPALALAGVAQGERAARPDLVVTGCSVFDFATRGGGVVAEAARAAAAALAPCVVVAGEVLIGSREMRTLGVEAAYAVRAAGAAPGAGEVGAEELAATARRISRSWTW